MVLSGNGKITSYPFKTPFSFSRVLLFRMLAFSYTMQILGGGQSDAEPTRRPLVFSALDSPPVAEVL